MCRPFLSRAPLSLLLPREKIAKQKHYATNACTPARLRRGLRLPAYVGEPVTNARRHTRLPPCTHTSALLSPSHQARRVPGTTQLLQLLRCCHHYSSLMQNFSCNTFKKLLNSLNCSSVARRVVRFLTMFGSSLVCHTFAKLRILCATDCNAFSL